MRGDDGSLFGLDRGSLTAIGAIMMGIGIILFLIAATSMMPSTSDPFDFAATQARMSSSFVTAYVASEASPAIERVSEAAAEGLKEGFGINPLKSEAVVKVKCRNCGYLENEDAVYCGKCGKRL